jgi:hypothetical protein
MLSLASSSTSPRLDAWQAAGAEVRRVVDEEQLRLAGRFVRALGDAPAWAPAGGEGAGAQGVADGDAGAALGRELVELGAQLEPQRRGGEGEDRARRGHPGAQDLGLGDHSLAEALEWFFWQGDRADQACELRDACAPGLQGVGVVGGCVLAGEADPAVVDHLLDDLVEVREAIGERVEQGPERARAGPGVVGRGEAAAQAAGSAGAISHRSPRRCAASCARRP